MTLIEGPPQFWGSYWHLLKMHKYQLALTTNNNIFNFQYHIKSIFFPTLNWIPMYNSGMLNSQLKIVAYHVVALELL